MYLHGFFYHRKLLKQIGSLLGLRDDVSHEALLMLRARRHAVTPSCRYQHWKNKQKMHRFVEICLIIVRILSILFASGRLSGVDLCVYRLRCL